MQPISNIVIWKYDFNGDLKMDYFVSIVDAVSCGTGGCSTTLFLSNDENYKVSKSPHLHSNTEIGYDGSYLYLQGGRSGCGVWKLVNDKIVHNKNIEQCPV